MKQATPAERKEISGQSATVQPRTHKAADWLLETAVSVLCELIEATSEQFGFRGFGVVDVYNDHRVMIGTTWDRRTDVFGLEISDTFLRSVDEQQLKSLLVRAMAFAAIGCHKTLAHLDDEAAAASESWFAPVRAIKLRRVLRKQRQIRHALEFLADMKTLELGLEKGLMRFLESHQEPRIQRWGYKLGWNIWVPSYEQRLARLREEVKPLPGMSGSALG
jgi:hypothetical protein